MGASTIRVYPLPESTGKAIKVIPDDRAAKHQQIRTIDELGEAYLYPRDYFVPIELPQEIEKVFSLVTCLLHPTANIGRKKSPPVFGYIIRP
ncbi:MAG: hypothetical protein Q7J76_03060 [Candidatus Brocadiaceae bacterium]|nr:hypothetical protein [Candidatus Brocadiaceae bacterium]